MFSNPLTGWSTPKKMDEVEFVPLTPQDATGLHKYSNDTHENLATPFTAKKLSSPRSQKRIFQSCPGISEKVEIIHQQTDDVVQKAMHNTNKTVGYVSPYKATKKLLTPCEKSLDKTTDRKDYGSSRSGLSIQSYTKRMSPSQAAQCQDLFSAKDEIIEQKDIIMQKQKMIITQLRQTNIELEELLVQKEHQIQSNSNEKFTLHLQEYQYQVSHLKQQLVEAKSVKQAEVEKLQRKLGEREYELGKLGIKLKEMEINNSSDVTVIKKELDEKVQELKLEQAKTDKLLQDLKVTKQENAKLQSYLEELPTAEEFKKLRNEIKNCRQEKDDIQEKKEVVHKRYKEIKTEYQNKDIECKKLQRLNTELRDQISSLSNILGKYRARDKLGPVAIEDHEKLKQENDILKKEKDDLKHSLEKRHKKMNRLHYEFLSKQKLFDEEKLQQKETLSSLKEELQEKSVTISKLSARSQELLENNLDLQQDLIKYKETYRAEYQVKLKSLLKEISHCSDDVGSFVTLCASRMKGNDPSLNALLGLQDSPEKSSAHLPGECETTDLETVNLKLELLGGIRSHIEELRQMLSEQYAQEIGDNMCVTQ